MEKRHIKKVVEDENNVHIIYGKSEDWEGIMVDGEKRNYHEEEKDMHDKDEERKKIGTLITDGLELPLFETEKEAKEEAEKLGGDPPMCHQHTVDGETYYMPFKDHEEAKEVLNNRSMHEEEEEKMHHEDRDAHYKALIKKILDMLEENAKDMHEEDRDEHYEEKLKEIEETLRIMHEEEKDYHDEDEEKDMHEEKSFRNKKNKTEKRYYNMETRISKRGNKNIVVGHAAVYGKLSEDLGGFREMIKPNAFDSVLENDVRVFFNHDPNYILGRTKAGTAKISSDKTGLKYEFEVPDTQAGRDLLVSLERGDISQSSFAFSVDRDSWSERDGRDIRTIEKVKRLYDVSPVSIPAYPDADDIAIAKRSLKNYKNESWTSTIKRSLLDLKIKILKNK